MRTYRSIQGDMIDALCRREYGDESGFVEAVLAANPGLAAQPPRLPAGIVIRLPDLPRAEKRIEVVNLWD